jgi:predicted Zn-dependent protease
MFATPPAVNKYQINLKFVGHLLFFLFLFFLSACTIKRAPIDPDTIPQIETLAPGDKEFGETVFTDLRQDYKLDENNKHLGRLLGVFKNLTQAAEVDHLAWHIHLLDAPDIAGIRAVHGNYIFVWSGIFDVVKDDDELAALLACEMSHVLAHHTDPVKFNIWSDILFNASELITNLGFMVLSQGGFAVGGQGWMKSAYVEVADLDPVDRKYSEEYEREAVNIALMIIERTEYSPDAMLEFWKRIAADAALHEKCERLSRNLSPRQRVALLEDLL